MPPFDWLIDHATEAPLVTVGVLVTVLAIHAVHAVRTVTTAWIAAQARRRVTIVTHDYTIELEGVRDPGDVVEALPCRSPRT